MTRPPNRRKAAQRDYGAEAVGEFAPLDVRSVEACRALDGIPGDAA